MIEDKTNFFVLVLLPPAHMHLDCTLSMKKLIRCDSFFTVETKSSRDKQTEAF